MNKQDRKESNLDEIYYDTKQRMFFITSESSAKDTRTGFTICLNHEEREYIDTTWTWKDNSYAAEKYKKNPNYKYICNVVDLFREVEKKIVDKD